MENMSKIGKVKKSKSKDSAPAEKPFPFLQLPGELRTEVYKNLFAGKASIFPDVTGSRKFRSCNHHLGTLEKPHPLDVALLQTCRLIHEEAAPILYSQNAFGFTTHVVCNKCIDRQIDEEENAFANGDPEIPDPAPIYQVDCGLQLMYTWLCLIGNRNRACIEKIMIAIDDASYLYYDGEPKLVDDDHPDWTWSKPAGEFLGKALDLLARKNSINRLLFSLEGKPRDKEALSNHFFHNGMESKLFTKLAKINNPGMRFVLRPLPEEEEHKGFYMRLRAKMEYQEEIQKRRAALKAKLIAEKRQAKLARLAKARAELAASKSSEEVAKTTEEVTMSTDEVAKPNGDVQDVEMQMG